MGKFHQLHVKEKTIFKRPSIKGCQKCVYAAASVKAKSISDIQKQSSEGVM